MSNTEAPTEFDWSCLEELISMDTTQNEVIVEEEWRQDYNSEDEALVFIYNGSESDSDYNTQDLIYHSN